MLNKIQTIGVIGAGTMGIGIAEVAASKGQTVKLFDVNIEFAYSTKNTMSKRLSARVSRGKITPAQYNIIVANIEVVDSLEQLANCKLVIEAIVENLAIKQDLFKQLQDICSQDTLFASNTSSISITAIATVLQNPANMIGLHFFNPAPVMQLVEVIAGLHSSQQNLAIGVELCKFWHKTPVLAKSSPGFIVNKVARPFYGEALKMLQEQVASPEVIDAIMLAAGFRMGPFILMDLIGMDINLAVSQTVFKSMYYDPRYKPSLIQQEMVAANLLGKKTGQGFYKYDGSDKPVVSFAKIKIIENLPEVNTLLANIQLQQAIRVDDCELMLSNGQTCKQRLQTNKAQHICHIDLTLDYKNCSIVHICFDDACPATTRNKIIALLQQHAKAEHATAVHATAVHATAVIVGKDLPAQIAMRIVCMLINEAADAIENGVCSEQDVDIAMQKGVNYPIGLIAWAYKIGIKTVVDTLDNLHKWFGEDRYRVSPWLRKQL
ncbi:MAG: 3-hydroxyacyl-CoA dehydrogenase [Proteobacteria bacterium]|nr:3-hydroxyacyl-CoA dehydrogenase [Pseudomonadota bacterium]